MSGGSLDYFYSTLEDHAGDFEDRELDDLVKDMAKLFYDREWFLSGDTNEGKWREARDAFKQKWFSEHGRRERIEKYLNDLRDEVLDSLGLSKAYCKNCKHWTWYNDESDYGKCDLVRACLMHRGEKCEQFEEKEINNDN